jgi:hypothetical protein
LTDYILSEGTKLTEVFQCTGTDVAPTFTGIGVDISGTWPNLVFTVTGGTGTGTSPQFIYTQEDPLSSWTIIHPLNKYPSVSIVDLNGNVVYAEIQYTSLSIVVISFSIPFSGQAFLE